MKLGTLIGAGHKIMAFALPFAAVAVVVGQLWPHVYALHLGRAAVVLGVVFLAVGLPLWLGSAVQVLRYVPRGQLITRGPFAMMVHPLYTSVALLVIPGIGFLFDSWLGAALGVVVYLGSRIWSVEEERQLRAAFPGEYDRYRAHVLLPWL